MKKISLAAALFVDVFAATELKVVAGEKRSALRLSELLGVLKRRIETNGGEVLKSEGDDLFAVFERGKAPSAAVRSAVECHLAAREHSMQLYAGLASGPMTMNRKDGRAEVSGMCINLAHRLHKLVPKTPGHIFLDEFTVRQLEQVERAETTLYGPRPIDGAGTVVVYQARWDHSASAEPTEHLHGGSSLPSDAIEISLGGISKAYKPGAPTKILIGRSSNCQFKLPRDEKRVSAEHLRLTCAAGIWIATDISQNGTWVKLSGASKEVRMLNQSMPLMARHGYLGLGRSRAEDPRRITTVEYRLLSA